MHYNFKFITKLIGINLAHRNIIVYFDNTIGSLTTRIFDIDQSQPINLLHLYDTIIIAPLGYAVIFETTFVKFSEMMLNIMKCIRLT